MWDWFTGIRHFELCNRVSSSIVSFNNEKHCREIGKHKIAVCEKSAGLRSGTSSDLDSASLKVLVPVNIFLISSKTCTMKLKDTGTQHTDCYHDILLSLVQ